MYFIQVSVMGNQHYKNRKLGFPWNSRETHFSSHDWDRREKRQQEQAEPMIAVTLGPNCNKAMCSLRINHRILLFFLAQLSTCKLLTFLTIDDDQQCLIATDE